MANLVTDIPSLNFAGNFPDLEFDSDLPIILELIRVIDGQDVSLFTETYSPNGDDKIFIEFRELFESLLAVNIPPSDQSLYEQETGYGSFKILSETIPAQTEIVGYVFTLNNVLGDFFPGDVITQDDPISEGVILDASLPELTIEFTSGAAFEDGADISNQTRSGSANITNITEETTEEIDPTEYTFTVIKGGVQSIPVSDEDFIGSRFLSWQESNKHVKSNDPEWLTFYGLDDVTIKARAYMSDGGTQDKNLYNFASNKLISFKCTWSHIRSSFDAGAPVRIDVWAEYGEGVKTNLQTYRLSTEHFDFDDIYVFANSLGGVDTIRFTGVNNLKERFQTDTAFYDREQREYFVTADRGNEKNTGGFRSRRHLLWARDFFASDYKFLFAYGIFFRVVTNSAQDLLSRLHTLNSYTFTYKLSEQTLYQNYLELNPEEVIIDDDVQYVKVPEGDFILDSDGGKLEFY